MEGDVSFTQCDSDETYDSELSDLCSFYAPFPSVKTLDENGWTHYYQDRAELFIDPARAAGVQSVPACRDDEEGEED